MSELLEFCRAKASDLRRDIETLVRLESPSHDKAAVDRCGAALADRLRAAGARVTYDPQPSRGDHIRAEFPGGPSRVLLLGHFDTVWDIGQLQRMPLREEDGCLYGPGIFDMKAGIAIAIHAVEALHALHPEVAPAIAMLWTTDEEIGSQTSRATIEAEARLSDAVLVLEPSLPGGGAKTQRKGCGEFVVTAQGVLAHAGIDPASGASAIHELAHQILQLETLNDRTTGVSVNVGVIRGGTRPNVIAESATAVLDVRVPTSTDAARLAAAVRALTPRDGRVRLEITGGIERPPLERTEGVVRLFQRAREVAAALGRELREGQTGGGSDGNFTAALGVPTLDGLGPEGAGAHALHEHVRTADLPWRAALVGGLLRHINTVK